MASTTTEFKVQALYVGYLGRAAELAGRDFWANAIEGGSVTYQQVAADFALSPEFQSLYGGLTTPQLVNAVYKNVLGRPADPAGLQFWVDQVTSGAVPKDLVVLYMIDGMSAFDRVRFDSRVQDGNAYTDAHPNDYVLADAQAAVGLLNQLVATVDGQQAASVNEGQTVLFKFSTIDFFPGSTLNYTITGVQADDVIGGQLSGQVTLDVMNKAVVSVTLKADAVTEGVENMTLSLGGLASTIAVQDTSTAVVPTYSIAAAQPGYDEGQTAIFNVETTNVPAGTVLSFTVSGVSADDVVGGALAGTTVVNAFGRAQISIELRNDLKTEGNETMTVTLTGTGASASTVIADTSLTPPAPTYALEALVDGQPATEVAEGQTVQFLLTTTNVAAGTVLQYAITGISAADVVGGSLTGQVTVDAKGAAIVEVTLAADAQTEGTETMTLFIAGQNVSVDVLDTSTTGNTLTINADTLIGSAGQNTIFYGPLVPNVLGQFTNSLQSTDSITGGAGGQNELVATVIAAGTNIFGTIPIAPNVVNVQKVFLTATGGDDVTIDAFQGTNWNMTGVVEWWNVNSDADLTVTDATLNSAVGWVNSAKGVDYTVNFLGSTLGAAGGDTVTVVLDGVGNGETGGELTIGSTTPGNANLARRGIETFNVLVGENSSKFDELQTTGNRLTTVYVAAAGAGANTMLEIDDAFENLSKFDAEEFVGKIGSPSMPMQFDYFVGKGDKLPEGSTFAGTANLVGGDGGNVMQVNLDDDYDAAVGKPTINLTGGASDDILRVEGNSKGRGVFNEIKIDAKGGTNAFGGNLIQVEDVSGGSISIKSGDAYDEVNMEDFDTTGAVSIDVANGGSKVTIKDGANNIAGGGLSIVAGEGFDRVLVTDTNTKTGNVKIDLGNGGSEVDLEDVKVGTVLSSGLIITVGNDGGLGNDIRVGPAVEVSGNASITTGDGYSKVVVTGTGGATSVNGSLAVSIGNGNAIGTTNVIAIDNTKVGSNVDIDSQAGKDDVSIKDSTIGNNLSVETRGGADKVTLTNVTFAGSKIDIDTGTEGDTVSLTNVTIAGPVTIVTDGGVDTVTITGGDFRNLVTNSNLVKIETGTESDTVTVTNGQYNNLSIDTGNDDAGDTVSLKNVSYNGKVTIVTGGGDDTISYRATSPGGATIDGGSGFDTFLTEQDLATNPGNTPALFTNVEKLVMQRDDASQAVDMAVLNSKKGDGNVVQQVWVQPEVTGPGTTTIANLATDQGQEVIITDLGLPAPVVPNPWNSTNGFVGDVYISTLIDPEADNRTVRVTVDASNGGSASNNPVTAVGRLDITDNSIGVASVEVVRLTSTGTPIGGRPGEPRNAIQQLNAPEAELLRIVGGTDLALHIGDVAGDGNDQIDLYSSLNVVQVLADTFAGDLSLVLLGSDLSNGIGGARDLLWANSDQKNVLVLYGDLDVQTGTGAGQTDIRGFQTVQFGTSANDKVMTDLFNGSGPNFGAEYYFDAAGMDAGVVYVIERTKDAIPADGPAFELRNLNGSGSGANVVINAPNINTADSADITLDAVGTGSGTNTLNLALIGGTFVGSAMDLVVTDFDTLNLDIVSSGPSATYAWTFDLFADDDLDALIITGGDTDDSLVLGAALPTTINVIDVSGFAGSFTGAFVPTQHNPGADVTFKVGGADFNFALTELTPALNGAVNTSFTLDFNQANLDGGASGIKVLTLATNFGPVTFSATVGNVVSLSPLADSAAHAAAFVSAINSAQGVTLDGTFVATQGTNPFGGSNGVDKVFVTFIPTTPVALDLPAPPFVTLTASTGTLGTMSVVGGAETGGGNIPSAIVNAQFNSVFVFEGDQSTSAEWTIDNFVAGGFFGANINNWSKLDLSLLGVTEDIGVNAVVGDWTGDLVADGLIVTADGWNFTIQLTGVFSPDFLTNDNLIFAVG